MTKIRFSCKAVEDLTSIWNYTYNTWSERQADEYYNKLIFSCKKILSSNYRLAKSYSDIADNLYGFRAGHHLIFYTPLPNGEILIVRILNERMDVKRYLRFQIIEVALLSFALANSLNDWCLP